MTFATRFNITKGYLAFTGVYFLTFVLGLAIIGLYATDVQRAKEENAKLNSKWIFAVVVGGLSSVTSLVYAVPFLFHAITIIAPVWNLILFVLNITLFGVFAKLFLHEHGNGTVTRMRNAIWVDLVSALFWFGLTIASAGYWWKHRDIHTRFTGRARV